MSFFKADRSLGSDEILEQERKRNKLRYVIDSDGKGYWIKPLKALPTDYEEDVPF